MMFLVLEDEPRRWEIDLGGKFPHSASLLPVWVFRVTGRQGVSELILSRGLKQRVV